MTQTLIALKMKSLSLMKAPRPTISGLSGLWTLVINLLHLSHYLNFLLKCAWVLLLTLEYPWTSLVSCKTNAKHHSLLCALFSQLVTKPLNDLAHRQPSLDMQNTKLYLGKTACIAIADSTLNVELTVPECKDPTRKCPCSMSS